MRKRSGCAAAILFGVLLSANAAEQVYTFSGVLTQSVQFAPPIPEWNFLASSQFSGRLVYDPNAIQTSWDYIDQPDWRVTFHYSPLISLDIAVDTPSGPYVYSVPTLQLKENAFAYAAVASGSANGISMRWHNYPVGPGWGPGDNSMPIPPSAYVGSYTPHMAWLSIFNYIPQPVGSTSANINLIDLFAIGEAGLEMRFSDPHRWDGTGRERLDAYFYGRIDEIALVPEPAGVYLLTSGLILLGFRLIANKQSNHRLPCIR
jgi:hypothetical protein